MTLEEDAFELLDGLIRGGILKEEEIGLFILSKNVDRYLEMLERLALLHPNIETEVVKLTEEELKDYGGSQKVIIKEKREST